MLKTASSVTNALGALVYQGTWDANANSPTLTSSVGTKGNYYVVSVSGTTNLNGISSWSVGDWAVFNGSVWQKVDGGTSESFVNLTVTGTANIATGNVVNMTSSNVTITGGTENAVTYTNVTVSSGNVTVTNDNVAYSNISTALRTQSLTGYLYGNANTGNVTASTSIPVANVTGAVSSVTGTSPISSSGGTTPAISLNTSGVTAASYGGAANSATITVDTYGRITAASNTAIAIANTQVSGLGTMSTQNSNNVTITGGNVGANLSTSTAIPVANATGTLAIGNGGTGLTSFNANQIYYGSFSQSATLTFDGTTLTSGAYTLSTGNLTFGSTSQKFLADFTNATVASRLLFQTSTTNSTTGIYAVPSGTATAASWQATNAADPTNASKILIATNGTTDVQLVSGINGTGTYLPLSFYTNGAQKMQLDTLGRLLIGTTASGSNYLQTGSDVLIHGLTVGQGAGSVSTNTAVGTSALAANTTGSNNVSFGYQSLYSNTTASNNTAVGYQAAYSQTTGGPTDAFGYVALYSNTTGQYNSAFGRQSLYTNTTGSQNVGLGQSALLLNTTGGYNTAGGVNSLVENTTGSYNTAFGNSALFSNTTASNNTAVGYQAGYSNTTGSYNTAFGYNAGYGITTGNNNTYLGYAATQSSSSVAGEIVICVGSTTGKGGATGFINPAGGGVYQGNNSSSWSTTSDQRLKKNIVENTVGLSAVNQIKVRNFEYRLPDEITELDKSHAINISGVQIGPIAQELQQVLPDCVKTESTGVMSVDTSNITWHLINAVKELSAELNALKAKVGA